MITLKNCAKSKKAHYMIFLIVLLCGVLGSIGIYFESANHIEKDEKFSSMTFARQLNDELQKYSSYASAIASLVLSTREQITPEHFAHFAQGLSAPSGVGFHFAQYVPNNKRTEYENSQKNILGNDFTIHPEGDRKEYLPITLSYPDKLPYGADILSPLYKYLSAVKASRSSLTYTLSEPMIVSFPGWAESTFSDTFVIRLPVYLPVGLRAGKITAPSGFHGIVGVHFRVGTLLKSSGALSSQDLLYRIADVTFKGDPVWFSSSANVAETTWGDGEYNTNYLSFAGRQWRIDTIYSADARPNISWGYVISPFIFFMVLACILAFYTKKLSLIYHSALSAAAQRLEIDELTGLLSRYRVQQVLNELMVDCQKEDKWLATLVLDLDHFKTINDAFGHEVGDKLLAKVAQRLTASLPNEAIIGYLGGDAFLAIVTENDAQDTVKLKELVKEVILQISQSYFVDNRTLNIGCSIGVALAPDFGADAVTLIKNADMAVYQAKNSGRATYHFYDGEMGKKLVRNVRIESRLRHALANEEIELHFQPKVDIVTERCVGMEALLRWNDEELGTVSPAEFIPLAEQTGIILPLGEWVIEQALRHIVEWQKQGICVPPIAINCSAAQLKRVDFLPKLLDLLNRYKVDPGLLEIEVTESILIEDAEGCAELLRQISRLGIKLAIDDFGTGYSSLSYLKDLPFDYIKIDQVFIRDITEEHNHAALTHAIIVLSHNLNLKVIAEGITNTDQLIMLKKFGCDIGQGYFFSKALGANLMGTDPMILALNQQDSL
ncbi:EAL domain-containing protein [Marinomonas sp. 5E14-1]|uniref:bifunctional diguanylate cyclase/phosphodiesterase n=1 Tax=Marinomonas sp. 5E14-1 TaxID=3153922 RepID=UPI003264B3EE